MNNDLAEFLGWHLGDGCISVNERYSEYTLTGDITEEYPFYKEVILPSFNKIFRNNLKKNVELKRYNLIGRNPILVEMDDFDFQSLNIQFNYALAQSVFTHLPLNKIIRCVMNIEKVLVQNGRFYATFYENPWDKSNLGSIMHPTVDGSAIATYFDRDPFHYDFENFKQICKGTSLHIEYIGDWNHPRDQKMLVFRKI